MTTAAQILYDDKGRPEFAVIPYAQFLALTKESTLTDEELFDLAKAQLGTEEPTPHDVLKRLLAGENPVKVHREWRGLTQAELAAATGVSEGYVSQVERGTRHLSRKARGAFAQTLRIDADDLEA
ncbi:MAG: hypothetical protein A2516_11445 [Alphaproteobacteria bacterium RIFOXYD12_FULL_60_8]|nr:MAG: hypothetical protein A2516_11445 [Alphaproteobacteria bacterium RIFOXYD12_FULL_60_8]